MYPLGTPCSGISNVWEGSFSPQQVVGAIIDNVTPVNKNNMRLSVGQQVSLVQNFVNANYLARSEVPINSGFMNYLSINSAINADGSYTYYAGMPRSTYISVNTTGLYFRETRVPEGAAPTTEWRMKLKPATLQFYYSDDPAYSELNSYQLKIYNAFGDITYGATGISATRNININNRTSGYDLIIKTNNIVISGSYMTIYNSVVPGSPDEFSVTTKTLGGTGNRWNTIYSDRNISSFIELFDNTPVAGNISNGYTTPFELAVDSANLILQNHNNVDAEILLKLNTSKLTSGNLVMITLKKDDTYTGGVVLGGNIANAKLVVLNPGTGVAFMVAGNKLNPLFPDALI